MIIMRKIIILAVVLILLAGCLDMIGGSLGYRDEYTKYLEKRIPAASEGEACPIGNCTCMICQNNSFFFNLWDSLAGGSCFFQQSCDEVEFKKYLDPTDPEYYGSDYAPRLFMLGAGPSFFDFGEANRYCNGRLTMAVHWLTGSEGKDYDMPDGGRAICMLKQEVMPVYVLYSKGENIDAGASRRIGEELGRNAFEITQGHLSGSVGPVIITTELNYDAFQADEVVEQIYQLNEGCNNHPPDDINCFIAVAPKIGDKEALDAVMAELGDDREYVQMLAFGIDSHLSNGSCRGENMLQRAKEFAAYGLHTYGLPTVIPYVLYDEGTVDPVTGCVWQSLNVEEGYRGITTGGIEQLRQVGVIGIAPYSFNSSQFGNPLECISCDVGASRGRIENWFGGCQRITKISNLQAGGGFPIVFPNESGGDCNFASQGDYLSRIFEDSTTRDILYDPVHPIEELQNVTWRCDECIAEGQDLYDLYPVLRTFESYSNYLPDLSKCEVYPAVEYYASRFSVDPMLVRGVINFENPSWNPCSVSCALSDGNGGEVMVDGVEKKCVGGRYSVGYDIMEDPDDLCYEDFGCCNDLPALLEPEYPGQYRFLAMGMMQIMISPYSYWPVERGGTGEYPELIDLFLAAEAEGRTENVEAARACAEEFNPFNASHNICRGTNQLQGVMRNYAENFMDEAEARCYLDTDLRVSSLFHRSDRSREEVMRAFIATYQLSGVWEGTNLDKANCGDQHVGDCWADEFCAAVDVAKIGCYELAPRIYPEGCTGLNQPDESKCYDVCWNGDTPDTSPGRCNFIAFVNCIVEKHELCSEEVGPGGAKKRSCELSADAGLKKIFGFNYYNQNCPNSNCPPWKKMLEADPTLLDNINQLMIDPETGKIIQDDPYIWLETTPGS